MWVNNVKLKKCDSKNCKNRNVRLKNVRIKNMRVKKCQRAYGILKNVGVKVRILKYKS